MDHVNDNHLLIPKNVFDQFLVEKYPKINSLHVVFPHLFKNIKLNPMKSIGHKAKPENVLE